MISRDTARQTGIATAITSAVPIRGWSPDGMPVGFDIPENVFHADVIHISGAGDGGVVVQGSFIELLREVVTRDGFERYFTNLW